MNHSKRSGTGKHEQMQLDLGIGKMVRAEFDGGKVSSDGGLLLFEKADRYLGSGIAKLSPGAMSLNAST